MLSLKPRLSGETGWPLPHCTRGSRTGQSRGAQPGRPFGPLRSALRAPGATPSGTAPPPSDAPGTQPSHCCGRRGPGQSSTRSCSRPLRPSHQPRGPHPRPPAPTCLEGSPRRGQPPPMPGAPRCPLPSRPSWARVPLRCTPSPGPDPLLFNFPGRRFPTRTLAAFPALSAPRHLPSGTVSAPSTQKSSRILVRSLLHLQHLEPSAERSRHSADLLQACLGPGSPPVLGSRRPLPGSGGSSCVYRCFQARGCLGWSPAAQGTHLQGALLLLPFKKQLLFTPALGTAFKGSKARHRGGPSCWSWGDHGGPGVARPALLPPPEQVALGPAWGSVPLALLWGSALCPHLTQKGRRNQGGGGSAWEGGPGPRENLTE